MHEKPMCINIWNVIVLSAKGRHLYIKRSIRVRLSPPNALTFIARHIEWRVGNAAAAFLHSVATSQSQPRSLPVPLLIAVTSPIDKMVDIREEKFTKTASIFCKIYRLYLLGVGMDGFSAQTHGRNLYTLVVLST